MIATQRQVKEGIQYRNLRLLSPEEAVYLYEFRDITPEGLETAFRYLRPFLYFTYRNLRERGLFATFSPQTGMEVPQEKSLRAGRLELGEKRLTGRRVGSFTVVENAEELYYNHWFGQFGLYKIAKGKLLFLDPYESYYLQERGLLQLDIPRPKFYSLYKYWRDRGWVIKSGYKFGTVFRVYPYGTSPQHFRHSLFLLEPQSSGMAWWEASRAIRVSHGVRKHFLVEAGAPAPAAAPFLYVRKERWRWLVMPVSEDERLSTTKLWALWHLAQEHRLIPLVAVADRDTATSFYRLGLIHLGERAFFSIDWTRL